LTVKFEARFNRRPPIWAAFFLEPMKRATTIPLIDVPRFILSIREAGYQSTSSALAELIDNSCEADARKVEICIVKDPKRGLRVMVSDDGRGMTATALRAALQFGGSSHTGARRGIGRFGMGLPTASLSQARRVSVYTSTGNGLVSSAYLDIEEVAGNGSIKAVRSHSGASEVAGQHVPRKGTVVVWSKCDRVTDAAIDETKLRSDLGRLFRHLIWKGLSIHLNGEAVAPVDPLFIRDSTLALARAYGPVMEIPITERFDFRKTAIMRVRIRWSELPVERLHSLSVSEKQRLQEISPPGLSIVRGGREIDRGWFFFGSKRKQNYDAWWRAEIEFDPALDEHFGVNALKQGIRPTDQLVALLNPHVEATAYELYRRTREKFLLIRQEKMTSGVRRAQARDRLLDPPPSGPKPSVEIGQEPRANGQFKRSFSGWKYKITRKPLPNRSAFIPSIRSGKLNLILNDDHPLICGLFGLNKETTPGLKTAVAAVELLLLSFARTEVSTRGRVMRKQVAALRERWSDTINAFLT
jgi:Histidine kinase-, DNA gyrase B-, and HSP90-like ATPase